MVQRPSRRRRDALNQLSYASKRTRRPCTMVQRPSRRRRDALNQLSYASFIADRSREAGAKVEASSGPAVTCDGDRRRSTARGIHPDPCVGRCCGGRGDRWSGDPIVVQQQPHIYEQTDRPTTSSSATWGPYHPVHQDIIRDLSQLGQLCSTTMINSSTNSWSRSSRPLLLSKNRSTTLNRRTCPPSSSSSIWSVSASNCSTSR